MKSRSSAPASARCTRRPLNSAASVPGAIGKEEIGFVAGRGAARIDDDDLGAAPRARVEHAAEEDRVAPGRVRADEDDEVGLVEVLVAAGHRVGAESAPVAGDRRRHAQPRIGVDVARADEALHQLVGDVVVLGEELAREVEGDGVGPVLRGDAREALRGRGRAPRPNSRACRRSSGAGAGRRARASRRARTPSSTAGRSSTDARGRPRSRRRRARRGGRSRRSRRRNTGMWCGPRRRAVRRRGRSSLSKRPPDSGRPSAIL